MIRGGCLCGAIRFEVERFVEFRMEWDGLSYALPQRMKRGRIPLPAAAYRAGQRGNAS